MHVFASLHVSKRVFGHFPKCVYMYVYTYYVKDVYIHCVFVNVYTYYVHCVFVNAYICTYAHLHFWSIISIIYCALYGNLYHLFVFVNWIVWSKSWINDSPHIVVPFQLSIHLVKIGGVYKQPPFSSLASVLYIMFFTFWFITLNGFTYTFIVSASGPKPWLNN